MNNVKSSVLILVLVGAAFAWGYSGKDLKSVIPSQDVKSDAKSTENSISDSTTPTIEGSQASNRKIDPLSKSAIPFPKMNKLGQGFPKTRTIKNSPPPGHVNTEVEVVTFGSGQGGIPKNPYTDFMKSIGSKRRTQLGESVKDFRVNSNTPVKRNAYFEKLSNQLKELQGKAGPVGTPQDAEDKQDEKDLLQTPSDNAAGNAEDVEDEFSPDIENEPVIEPLPGDEFIDDPEMLDSEIDDLLSDPEY